MPASIPLGVTMELQCRSRVGDARDAQHDLEACDLRLRELRHRFKNHLSLLISAVHVHSRTAGTEEARQSLRAVAGNVETLRLLHEHLDLSDQAERLRLAPYLAALANGLQRLSETDPETIRMELDVCDVELPVNVAMPLALIANEFIINSLGHAFDHRGGSVEISVARCAPGRIRVRMSDDGRGLRRERDHRGREDGCGRRLIDRLAAQIGAEAEWSDGGAPGTWLQMELAAG